MKTGAAEAYERSAPLQGTSSLTQTRVFTPRAAVSDIQLKKIASLKMSVSQGTCTEEKGNERQRPGQMQPL